MWNRLRITHRFIVVLAAFWLSGAAVVAISLWGLASSRDSLKMLHDHAMALGLKAGDVENLAVQNRMQVLLAFQHAPDGPLAAIHQHPVEDHLRALAANRSKISEALKVIEAASGDAQEQPLVQALQRTRAAWVAELDAAAQAVRGGDYSPEVMERFLRAGRTEGEAMVQAAVQYRAYQMQQADTAYRAAQQRYELALWIFAAATFILGLPASLLGLALLGRLVRGFRSANQAAAAIAASDLSRRIEVSGSDEIGAMLGQMETMRGNLNRVVGQVSGGAGAIAGASTQVAAGTRDLSARTEQQASALEQTASATEELSGTVQHNADSAHEASRLAAQATTVAQRGGSAMNQVVNTMQGIASASHRVADIIGVIDGIAFQTNILALNAAVEAARAGEQGRGFAVVAGEVRSLAGRSAEAAREIKALISDSVAQVEAGSAQVGDAGATMQEIVSVIGRVAQLVDEIALASREQSQGLAQINQAVAHLDGVTQQNAALVEQTSAASDSLQDQARQLAALAATFRLTQDSAGPALAPVAAPPLRPGSAPAAVQEDRAELLPG
ncbi:methyl-accepting chemotaxis protein [Melaminivora jejuensis]|uniref:methyl-accepting chemotaxis protein n=1 Tax=Melaminivora jejuensis TaxID=1267217 RepID=UPI001ADEBEA6|nr:methyl-accepting chemotaxis protein [Melaminivora jejuensis]UHJ65939.1 methyl-accepting chemotaxis protein [Melaminivora jejuensis]